MSNVFITDSERSAGMNYDNPESVKLTEIECNKKENNSISGFPLNEMLSA